MVDVYLTDAAALAEISSLHQSVLCAEVIAALAPKAGGRYVDATVGLGGHAEAILEASAPSGSLIAIDRDDRAIELSRRRLARFGDRVTFVNAEFSAIREIVGGQIDGLVADLGVSSIQLDDPSRGFSFSSSGPIDMRMGGGRTALELIGSTTVEELASILSNLGEVRGARRVARAILEAHAAGKLETTRDLAEAVARVSEKGGKTHPATRAFMALRIATNAELEELDALLSQLPEILSLSGRAALISFHSLEDRRVKQVARGESPSGELPRGLPFARSQSALALVGKSVVPSEEEIARNPRARSARLRVLARR
ncbi:MAG: 16S rRNA (cytosine(1402)-N(4))-methyltransferase RsmH [Deltaproteobacteria bacterium]|nr:16S rRNA (cytosine(1402)-N(4))-methyltransferase RsmH [Deltaproteobacteria bacterium]